MKRSIFAPPSDVPPGMVWLGGPIPWFSISLLVTADDLDPDEITRSLGVAPDQTYRKGDRRGRRSTARFGRWEIRLRHEDAPGCSVEVAIDRLLSRLPMSAAKWKEVIGGADARIFIGLTLDTENRGFELEVKLLERLATLGIRIGFDIYADP